MAVVTGLSDADVAVVCSEPDSSTNGFFFQQTMLRVKDAKKSLDFYTRILGMRLLQKYDFPNMKLSLFFLGHECRDDIPTDEKARNKWVFTRKGVLELAYDWGTESDEKQAYHDGNTEPKGFGHIGIVVPDVDAACERFEANGVEFVKKPNDDDIKIGFIKDPDGYWIEILNPDNVEGNVNTLTNDSARVILRNM